jgi:hypothetical protein
MSTLVAGHSVRNHLHCRAGFLRKAVRTYLTSTRCLTLATALTLAITSSLSIASAQNNRSHPYMTSNAIATNHVLLERADKDFDNVAFEWLVESLSQEHNLLLWCDRRVARDMQVTVKRLASNNQIATLEQQLGEAAKQVDAAILPMDGVVAIVPRSKRDAIACAYWQLLQSKKGSTFGRLETKPFQWNDGAVASDIVERFLSDSMQDARLTPMIEHDLWRAFEFRKCSIASISVCLLSGFDLYLAESENSLQIVPLPSAESLPVEWDYRQTDFDKLSEQERKAWKARWPDSKGTRVLSPPVTRIVATVMAHRDLIQPLLPAPKVRPKNSRDGKALITGEVKADFENVMKWVANTGSLEFYPLPLSPKLAKKEIDLKVKDVTLDDLLRLVAKQASIELRREGKRVQIVEP